MRRVVITGIGVITPIGIGREAMWANLRTPCSGIRRMTRLDATALRCQVAAEVHGFEAGEWIEPEHMESLDRFSRFSVAAARMALADARLDLRETDRSRVGCYQGSGLAGVPFYEIQYIEHHRGQFKGINRSLCCSVGAGAGCSNIARILEIEGPTSANTDSCSAGTIAIGRAARAIQRGDADVMLAGAAEAPLISLCFSAFDLIRAMSTHFNDNPGAASRPFDAARDGFVMGEGAAVLVLETEEHARQRGAPCIAEVSGFAITNDGCHMTAPRTDGSQAARAITESLRDANCAPDAIDVVSAHASSTPLNDSTETLALKSALGEHAWHAPVIATKSRHGHALGATGAIETAILALGLHHQWMPAALNLENPSPDCDLDYAQNGPVTGPFRAGLKNSFGFGGINACLVLRALDLHG